MAIGIIEIDAAAAVEVIDLTPPGTIEIGIKCDPGGFDARQRRIEFALADEKGVVLSAEVGGIGVVERYPVARADQDEMGPLRSCLQSEYIGEEPGGCPFIRGRNDGVIELDSHFLLPLGPVKDDRERWLRQAERAATA